MFGFLRFFLACIVLLNHSPYNTYPFDLAVTAVVIFYMISGYTMGIKFNRYKATSSRPIFTFFIDRVLRVYPLYFYFVTLTVISVLIYDSPADISNKLSIVSLIHNYLLIPVNYYMFTLQPTLIPAAYSLALEEQFYLLMPILLSFVYLIRPAIIFSGLIVVASMHILIQGYKVPSLQLYNDFSIYRLLPGVLIVFMLGIALDKNNPIMNGYAKKIFLFYCALFFIGSFNMFMRQGQIFSVSLGVLIGTPLIMLLRDMKRSEIDESFGGLAYGIFLSQSLVYSVLQNVLDLMGYPLKGTKFNIIAFVATLLLTYISYKIFEIPAHNFRNKIIKNLLDKYSLKKKKA